MGCLTYLKDHPDGCYFFKIVLRQPIKKDNVRFDIDWQDHCGNIYGNCAAGMTMSLLVYEASYWLI